MKEKLDKKVKGITLIALIVTIVVLLILAGVSVVMLTGENGLLKKATTAKENTNKSTATEKMNLKITNAQMKSYVENEQMPTLQELADIFYEDDEIKSVVTKDPEIASKEKITVGNHTSIYTVLEEYPQYEFEINDKLQLASINGTKVAVVPEKPDDTIATMTKQELQELISSEVTSQLSNNESTNNSEDYSTSEQVIGKWIDGKPLYRKVCYRTNLSAFNPNLDHPDVVNLRGSFYRSVTTGWLALPYSQTGYYVNVWYESKTSNIKFVTSDNPQIDKIFVIIEYTKTTDKAS